MYWRCKCGHKNPENARKCDKCGSTESATKKFYAGALVVSTFVFLLVYAVGASVGGTLVAFAVEPTDVEVFATAKALGMKNQYDEEPKSLYDITAEQRVEATAKATDKARSELSVVVRAVLFWIVPLILFAILGTVVGFSTAGRTIIEAAIGSAVGQGVGFLILRFISDVPISYLELGIGLVVGFFLVGVGAWVGEAIQEKKERATLEETRDSVVMS